MRFRHKILFTLLTITIMPLGVWFCQFYIGNFTILGYMSPMVKSTFSPCTSMYLFDQKLILPSCSDFYVNYGEMQNNFLLSRFKSLKP